jgi:spermidine synthase
MLVSLLAGIILLLSPFSLDLISLEPGDTVLEHRDGVIATVTILKDRQNEVHLKINNRFQMGGTSSVFSDRREGHIPLLLHPDPKQALFLGMGTGGTLAAAADHPMLRAVGVELVPEVIPLLHHFERATGAISRNPNLRLVAADARRYVNCSRDKYDVIVADLFHPARDGAGSLYTREHFQAIASRLNPGGIFCQWLPLYQMDLDLLRVIVRTFLEVFPDGSAFMAHYSLKAPIIGLVSSTRASGYPSDWWDMRMQDRTLREKLERLRLDSLYSLLGCFMAASRDLQDFAGHAPLNTDDRPVVTFQAPRFTYGEQEPAYQRLLALVDRFSPRPEQILATIHKEEDSDTHRRLASYWNARNLFIHAGVGLPETGDVRVVLRSARKNLLEVVRVSQDFTAAYLPLLAMARRLYPMDPEETKSLLLDLEEANPRRTEARTIRRELFAD